MHFENWFCTPIWLHKLDLKDYDFKQILEYCLQLKSNNVGRVLSNVGGWQSQDLVYSSITNTPLYLAFNQIIPLLQLCMQDLGSSKYLQLDNAWVNINSKTNWNKSHVHEGSVLSGVFYLTDNNSSLEIQRDDNVSTYFLDHVVRSNNQTDLSYKSITYTPTKNQLIIFPSWLKHAVLPSDSNDLRISVAFNTYFD
jgi:uncharacterized protein (TIGR02466 family)